MTELTFLIELLLNHDLPKDTKALIASRIKEVEEGLVSRPIAQPLPPVRSPIIPQPVVEPQPVIPQTEAAANALNARAQAIENALQGKNNSIYKARAFK